MRIRTYTELSELETFEDRFEYLSLSGRVGEDTFGFERFLNQRFYTSTAWKRARNHTIARDVGRDLSVEGREIFGRIIIHHMNPISPEDIKRHNIDILDPEYLITTQLDTHNAIHYGSFSRVKPIAFVERTPNDHIPWKR